jgi:hypothetical protein
MAMNEMVRRLDHPIQPLWITRDKRQLALLYGNSGVLDILAPSAQRGDRGSSSVPHPDSLN